LLRHTPRPCQANSVEDEEDEETVQNFILTSCEALGCTSTPSHKVCISEIYFGKVPNIAATRGKRL